MTGQDEPDYCLIGIGGWTVDANVASQNIRDERLILACNGGVLVGAEFFPMVALPDFIGSLKNALVAADQLSLAGVPLAPLPTPLLGKALTFDTFFHQLENNWNPNDILLSGVGFTLSIASYLRGVAQNNYLTDGVWLSIGYPVAAATGVAQACKRSAKSKKQRTFVVVGDGAFQEVCQAVSDQNFHRQNNVIFVLSNTIYGIEQFIVNPNPFREPPVDYPKKDDLLNSVYSYNDLHQWNFVKLAKSFGSIGRRVKSLKKLKKVFREIENTPGRNFLVEIVVPKTDIDSDIIKLSNDGKLVKGNSKKPVNTIKEEQGGMRFNDSMTELMNLIYKLKLEDQIVPFPMKSQVAAAEGDTPVNTNRFYFRGHGFSVADAAAGNDDIWGTLYDIKQEEKGLDPNQIISNAFNRILKANNWSMGEELSADQWTEVRENVSWKGQTLNQWHIWGLLRDMGYSEECIRMLADTTGFPDTFKAFTNAGGAFQLLADFPKNPVYNTFIDGFSTLPDAIVKSIKSKVSIFLSTNLNRQKNQVSPRPSGHPGNGREGYSGHLL